MAAIGLGLISAIGGAAPARAGAVLLSRQSSLAASAAGVRSAGGFNLSDAKTNFDSYANDINNSTNPDAPALSDAHQFSQPETSGSAFQGAYAEGTVRASLNTPHSSALAKSVFGLTFRVTEAPMQYTFGAAFGSAGAGATEAELTNLKWPGNTVFVATTDSVHGSSHSLDQQGILPPGIYGLKIWANTPGTLSSSSSAYYTVNFTLDPGNGNGMASVTPPGSGAVAAPLPPAAWTGLMMLGGMGVLMFRSRQRAVRITSG